MILEYRVWDKQRKEWVKNTGNPYVFPFNGKVAMTCAGNHTGHISDEDYSEYYEITWFTGLKDKNGTKIFEGDLIGNKTPELSVEFEIEYDQDSASFVGAIYDGFRKRVWQNQILTQTQDSYYNRRCVRQLEVVGNIFQNPELIYHPALLEDK